MNRIRVGKFKNEYEYEKNIVICYSCPFFFTLSSCLWEDWKICLSLKRMRLAVQRVEYRYISDEVSNASGQQIVKKVELGRSNIVIDKEASTVSLDVSVPAANEGSFPASGSGRNVQ